VIRVTLQKWCGFRYLCIVWGGFWGSKSKRWVVLSTVFTTSFLELSSAKILFLLTRFGPQFDPRLQLPPYPVMEYRNFLIPASPDRPIQRGSLLVNALLHHYSRLVNSPGGPGPSFKKKYPPWFRGSNDLLPVFSRGQFVVIKQHSANLKTFPLKERFDPNSRSTTSSSRRVLQEFTFKRGGLGPLWCRRCSSYRGGCDPYFSC